MVAVRLSPEGLVWATFYEESQTIIKIDVQVDFGSHIKIFVKFCISNV